MDERREIKKSLPVRLLSKFKSVKLAAWVIALLTIIYFLGLVIPQKWMFNTREQYVAWVGKGLFNKAIDFIGFTDIYLSPLTIALLAVFFVNLLVVSIYRVPIIMKKAFIGENPPRFGIDDVKKGKNVQVIEAAVAPGEAKNRLRKYLKWHRWHIFENEGASTFLAIRNRISPLGFLLFHLSFLLCLAGSLMITYTRFSGKLVLTEGQTFQNDISQFQSIGREPKIMKGLPSLGLEVDKVHAVYEKGVPSDLVIETLVAYGNETRRESLKVNEPINRGPVSIIAKDIGVSPLFVRKAPDGTETDGAWVSLNVLHGEVDSFKFKPDDDYTFLVRFYPDYYVEDGVEKTHSIEVKNPAMRLVAMKDSEKIYEGTIKVGEGADVGPFTVSFEDLRYWAQFQIVREYGKTPLVAGFVLACVGLIMRLVFYQKRIRVAVEDAGDKALLYIDGRSEYFQYSYAAELEKTVEKLRREVME